MTDRADRVLGLAPVVPEVRAAHARQHHTHDRVGRALQLDGELSTRSEEFRVRWAVHDVNLHRTGVKRFHHPVVGDLTLDFESLELPGDPGQKMLVYSAEPGSPSRGALDLLASWTSTTTQEEHEQRGVST